MAAQTAFETFSWRFHVWSSGCKCDRKPGHLLLQLPVCSSFGSSKVCVYSCFRYCSSNTHAQLAVLNLVCAVRSTTSSVTLDTWCWDSSSSSLSSRETSHTIERWFATTSTLWWGSCHQTDARCRKLCVDAISCTFLHPEVVFNIVAQKVTCCYGHFLLNR